MSYAEKLEALIAGTLAPEGFGHADHIGVACAALDRFEFFAAYAAIAGGLKSVAARAGVPEKFSATVTFAFLSEIAERRAGGAFRGPEDFVARNPDLAERGFLARRYSPERLASPAARSLPLLPDRVP